MLMMRRPGYRGYLSPHVKDITAMANNGLSPTQIAHALNNRYPGLRAFGPAVRHVLARLGGPIISTRGVP